MLEDRNGDFERDDLARTMSAEDIAKAEALAKEWIANFKAAQEN
jgi:hypothetical protein